MKIMAKVEGVLVRDGAKKLFFPHTSECLTYIIPYRIIDVGYGQRE